MFTCKRILDFISNRLSEHANNVYNDYIYRHRK